MSLFKQFATNQKAEIEGVRITYGPNADGTVPTFIIARMGRSNKAWVKAMQAATAPHQRLIDLGQLDDMVADHINMDVFVRTILKGWENIQRKDGSALQFSKENAMQLFTELPELYNDLFSQSMKFQNYKEAELEADSKN